MCVHDFVEACNTDEVLFTCFDVTSPGDADDMLGQFWKDEYQYDWFSEFEVSSYDVEIWRISSRGYNQFVSIILQVEVVNDDYL